MAKQCQSERTVQRHSALETSLLHLMRSKTFPEISVKDICQEAAIPRRTFYHYFTGKEDLLEAMISDLLLECDLEVMPEFSRGTEEIRCSLIRFYHFWGGAHRETLELLLRSNQAGSILRHAVSWARKEYFRLTGNRDTQTAQREKTAIASVAGVFSLLFYWIQSGCRETPEEMAEGTTLFLTEPFCKK